MTRMRCCGDFDRGGQKGLVIAPLILHHARWAYGASHRRSTGAPFPLMTPMMPMSLNGPSLLPGRQMLKILCLLAGPSWHNGLDGQSMETDQGSAWRGPPEPERRMVASVDMDDAMWAAHDEKSWINFLFSKCSYILGLPEQPTH